MVPRRWDVVRRVARLTAVLSVVGGVMTGCGQARLATPPAPEFTTGSRAVPSTVPSTAPTTMLPPGDGGMDPIGGTDGAPPGGGPVDVDQMLVVDDAGTATPNQSGWAAFDAELARRLRGNVAWSVAVMVDGEVVHAAAFGERIAGSGDPVEPTDRFRVASISKTVTAIVAMRLVEAGVLTLDEPVGDVLVAHLGVVRPDPDVASITVRELLSHTAGFPAHQQTFFGNGASSCVEAAARGLASGVGSGSGFSYSNMSYCVLGVLVEAVTGKTYERVVHEQLLTPLGISGMRMSSTYDLGPDEVSHHPAPGRTYMEALGAAGAWNATPTDLVRILDSIDPSTTGWKALSTAGMTAMRSRLPTGLQSTGYGLGLINVGDGFGHTGTIENTHAMALVQADGVTWAVTVSGSRPSESDALQGIVRAALAAAFPG